MKRVLLCAPFTKGDLFSGRWVVPPTGLWRIASYLKKYGHRCDVYDVNKPGAEPIEKVLEKGYDIIGFSVLEATIEYDLSMIYKVKKLCPDALIIVGGSGGALRYQFILDNAPVDIVVLAEGEYPVLMLCEDFKWQDIDGIVFKRQAKILSQEDFWEISKDLDIGSMNVEKYWERTAGLYDNPDYDEINTFRLFTTNYCSMGCNFCTLTRWRQCASGSKVPIVALTAEQIISMIKKVLIEHKDVRQIFFDDDDFFLLKGRGKEFCEKIIKEKELGRIPEYLKFICLTNINRIDLDNIGLMAKAGFRVLSIGAESVSQHVLDSLGKKQTVEQIWDVTELILSYGVKPYYTLIMFTPYGTISDLITDLEGFRKMKSMGVGLSIEPYLIPLPGTPFWEEMIPQSSRWIDIEGSDKRVKKGFAWLPMDSEVKEIFDEFERWYPKYRSWRFKVDGVKHREKNYQAGIILDAVEIVLRSKGVWNFVGRFTQSEARRIHEEVDRIEAVNVDIVGDFVM